MSPSGPVVFCWILMAGCSSVTATEDSSGHSLLFIGNSLTYVNDLPAVFAQVAEAAHDSVRVGMAAGPNLAVIDHTNGASDAVAKIDGSRWSFVVLQQGPTPAGMCRDTLIIAAMRLAPHITGAGARAAIFLPWARKGYPQSLDFATESVTLAARAVGGVVAPIGLAWRDARIEDPAIPLYGPDGYHPAPAGTLLAALTLYDRLLGRDVRGIPVESLRKIQAAAALQSSQIEALAAAAHQASTRLPADPPTPASADTTHVSTTGGPC